MTRNGWPSRIDVIVEDPDDVRVPELRRGAALAQEAFAQ